MTYKLTPTEYGTEQGKTELTFTNAIMAYMTRLLNPGCYIITKL